MQKMGFGLLAFLVPLQIVIGDLHGLNTLEHQPVKIAAIEANWETRAHAPLVVFGWPDEEAERNRFAIELPSVGSVILKHDRAGVVPGLKQWKRDDRPPVAIPFLSFRLMVGIGLAMLALTITGLWLWWRKKLDRAPRFQRLCTLAAPLGFVAVLAGWVTTEVGRQPWVVYGLLRTRDAVTPSLTAVQVAISLTTYVIAYVLIFGAGVVFMRRLVQQGFVDTAERDDGQEPVATPARPLSAATRAR